MRRQQFALNYVNSRGILSRVSRWPGVIRKNLIAARRRRTCAHARARCNTFVRRARYRVSPVVRGGEKKEIEIAPPDVRSTWREYQVSASNVIHVTSTRFPAANFLDAPLKFTRVRLLDTLATEGQDARRHIARKSFFVQISRLASRLTTTYDRLKLRAVLAKGTKTHEGNGITKTGIPTVARNSRAIRVIYPGNCKVCLRTRRQSINRGGDEGDNASEKDPSAGRQKISIIQYRAP